MFDIHENAFLTLFMLWLFYFLEKDRLGLVLLFSVLTFTVKEDTPVYIAVIAMYIFLRADRTEVRRFAVSLFVLSLCYFFVATSYLAAAGNAVYVDARFGAYSGGGGFTEIIKTILLNPAFIISESLTEAKALYLMQMLLPLSFLPLLNRNHANLLLSVPFVLKNLMPEWPYHHSVSFHYNFGMCAVFFYLFVMNFSQFKSARIKKFVLLFSACASILMFTAEIYGRRDIVEKYHENAAGIAVMREALQEIPHDKSVAASTFFVPDLYRSREVYQLNYPTQMYEYIAVDLRYNHHSLVDSFLETEQYELLVLHEGLIAVLMKTPEVE